MVNTSKIRARMDILGISNREVAGKIGVSERVFCKKVFNLSFFTLAQAEKCAETLKIGDKEFGEYFFV